MRPALVGGGALGLFLFLQVSLVKLKLYVVPVLMLLNTFSMKRQATWPKLRFLASANRTEALPANS